LGGLKHPVNQVADVKNVRITSWGISRKFETWLIDADEDEARIEVVVVVAVVVGHLEGCGGGAIGVEALSETEVENVWEV
jgi:hypothetical protein